jgi:ComF family protein
MLKSMLSRWADASRSLLLRWTCVACGAAAERGDLCEPCARGLPPLLIFCPLCAQPLISAAPACGRCLSKRPVFDHAWAPWRYQLPVDALIQRFKLGGKLAIGRALSERCADLLQAQRSAWPQLLIPVPLHPMRYRERGFDQALEIARVLGRRLALPVAAHGLQRIRQTTTQTGLKRKARRANVYRAFALGRLPSGIQHVALIDDVLTTGATVNACARVLRRAGVKHIEVWALARAGR